MWWLHIRGFIHGIYFLLLVFTNLILWTEAWIITDIVLLQALQNKLFGRNDCNDMGRLVWSTDTNSSQPLGKVWLRQGDRKLLYSPRWEWPLSKRIFVHYCISFAMLCDYRLLREDLLYCAESYSKCEDFGGSPGGRKRCWLGLSGWTWYTKNIDNNLFVWRLLFYLPVRVHRQYIVYVMLLW